MSVVETLKYNLVSLKIIKNGTIWKLGNGFLFAFHSNYGRTFSRFDTIHERDRHLARNRTTAELRYVASLGCSRAAKTGRIWTESNLFDEYVTFGVKISERRWDEDAHSVPTGALGLLLQRRRMTVHWLVHFHPDVVNANCPVRFLQRFLLLLFVFIVCYRLTEKYVIISHAERRHTRPIIVRKL